MATASTTVAAGPDHTLIVTVEGDIWAWGDNDRGQLGDGTELGRSQPAPVPGLDAMGAVAAGDGFSAALGVDGTVWTWGANDAGQLGDGTALDRSTPARVDGLPGIVAISAAADHVLVLAVDGAVWAWGGGRSYPWRIEELPLARRIAADPAAGFAATVDGAVWRWDREEPRPERVTELQLVSDLAAAADGSLYAVSHGAVVTLHGPQPRLSVAELPLEARSVAIAGERTIVVAVDGSVWTKATATAAGSIAATSVAVVPGLRNIVTVAAADGRALALERGGALWEWSEGVETIERVAVPEVLWRVHEPEFRPAEGAYPWPRYVTAESDTPAAEIHVTRDGRTPELEDPVLADGDAILVFARTELKARAWADDLDPSTVAEAEYEVDASPPDGAPADPDDRIRRVRDDEKNGADLIFFEGFESGELSAWSGFQPPATTAIGAPVLSPPGGVLAAPQDVTVTCPVPGAVVRYTTSGAVPTETDPVVPCGGWVTVSGSTTLRARAWAVGFLPSAVAMATFHITFGNAEVPVFDPPGGAYDTPQSVSLATSTAGATIRYTLDGTVPGFDSPIATGPVAVATTAVLTARSFRTDFVPSPPVAATYVIGGSGATGAPLLSPGSGTYPTGVQVTVSNTTPGVTIRYTTDGTQPEVDDEVITDGGTITVNRSVRIIARAWADGLEPSPATTADYNIVGDVAAGVGHSLALRADGTMVGWGYNVKGEVGDGTTEQRNTPVDIPTLTEVVAVGAGENYSMALRADGTVWTWGWNHNYRLGADVYDSPVPIQVQTTSGNLTGIAKIAAGYAFGVVIASDTTLWGWGSNFDGQLGLGNRTSQQVAVPIPNLSGISKVAAGGAHTLVLKTDGEVTGSLWAFGRNSAGQLGDGTTTDRLQPIKVLDGVRDICAGGDHSFALMADGTVLATGFNDYGNLGLDLDDGPVTTWTPVDFGGHQIEAMEASGVHSVALSSKRTLLAFGHNGVGQLGNRTNVSSSTPTPVVFLPDVVTVDTSLFIKTPFIAMNGHNLAVTADGRVWAWGHGGRGKIGNGYDSTNFYRPVLVTGLSLVDRSWPEGDADGDGLTNERELELGTDPFSRDSNGDGIDDLTAVRSGLDPLDPDMDDDGIDNAGERSQGTDPLAADSDGDGVDDGSDCFPRDPGRSQCPAATPGDTDPPVITLTEPTNAVLISSVP